MTATTAPSLWTRRLAASPGRRFVDALATWDPPALHALLDPEVWFRAMLVREVVERHDATATVALLDDWFGSAVQRELVGAGSEQLSTREHLTYRFLLRPQWAPDVWHEIEQTGYARIRDGRIRRLDLVCTGFAPRPDLQPPVDGHG
jgi:hypothetical protein